jgi:hypothetical protein
LPSLPISRRLLRPQSPSRRLSEVWYVLMDARAGCEMVSTQSPLGVLSTVNGYPKRAHSRPSGPACWFVFGYRLGTGVPPWGPAPHPSPAVHSWGTTALHYAADYGNRRIVGLLVDANADLNAQASNGCAVCARGESAIECAGRVPAAVGRAGSRPCTRPRSLAGRTPSRSCCCAAPTGPSRDTTGSAALRRTAEKPRARRRTPKQEAEVYGKLAQYEAGECQVHFARRLTASPQRCRCRRIRRRC